MTKQLIRAAATTVLGLSLTAGFAAADVSNTGPDSSNTITSKVSNKVIITNVNTLILTNSYSPTACPGPAQVSVNSTGCSSTSGNSTNTNSCSIIFSVTI